MSFLDAFRRRKKPAGPAGIQVKLKPRNRPRASERTTRQGMPRRLILGLALASLFYVLAHYSIIEGVWPAHGTSAGAGGLVIRDGIALFAWLAIFPIFRALGYRGAWTILALPVMIFFLTRPSLFQLFSDPVYQARSTARVEANTLKAERARLTTIIDGYSDERKEIVFENEAPTIPDPLDAVREATQVQRSSPLRLGSAFSVLIAPLAIILTYAIVRRPGVLRWMRDNRRIPFAVIVGVFFVLALFFVELGRVGGTTPWELFLPVFILVWAAVLADDVYNLARPDALMSPRRLAGFLAYGALPLIPFLLIRELGLSVVLAGSLATMLLVSTRRKWWAGLMVVIWIGLVFAAFNLDPRSANRLQLMLNPYRDLSTMTQDEGEAWAARMHQFKLFDANILAGGLLGEGAGRGHPETAPNAADDGYITTIAANWGLAGALTLVLLYTVLIVEILGIAVRERSAFERSLVAGLGMLLAIPFWMAALGGIRAVPLTGVATAFAANGGAKLLASSIVIGIIAAVSHRRSEADRLAASEDALHGRPDEQGIRIR